jgi:hypothetical protein
MIATFRIISAYIDPVLRKLMSGVLQNGSWAYLGKEKCAFHFSFSKQQTPIVHDTRPAKRQQIALLHAVTPTRALRATRMNHLPIQGNPKADFLE